MKKDKRNKKFLSELGASFVGMSVAMTLIAVVAISSLVALRQETGQKFCDSGDAIYDPKNFNEEGSNAIFIDGKCDDATRTGGGFCPPIPGVTCS